MDILEDIKDIMALQKAHDKFSRLEQLSDVFEYSHEKLNPEEVAEGTQLLLAAALQEDDKNVQESYFHAIDKAVAYRNIGGRVNWDTLATSLSSLGKWELEFALNILGFSGQAQYLPVLEEYAHHADPEVREWAVDAIDNITSRIAHPGDPQKETE